MHRSSLTRLGAGALAALVASLALVAVVMGGGAPPPQSAPPGGLPPIVGTWTWVQTRMSDDTVLRPFTDGPYTLTLTATGEAQVRAGCNNGNGRFTTGADRRITIGPLATTRALCPEGSTSDRFLVDLQRAAIYTLDGTTLRLDLPASSGTMQFSRTAPTTSQRSPAGNWTWVETVMNDGAIFRPTPDGPFTLNLLADNSAQVRAGCNSGGGGWTAQGNRIDIGPLAVTLALCPPGSSSERYLQDLSRVSTFFFDGNDLIMELPFDSGGMRFRQAQ